MYTLKLNNLHCRRKLIFHWILLFFVINTSFLTSCNKSVEESTMVDETEFCLVEINGNFQEVILEEEPEYLEGDTVFKEKMYSVLSYPKEARDNGVEGTCLLQYEITKQGIVENIVIIQDPGAGIGDVSKMALEFATQGVSYSPGIYQGQAVRVRKEIKFYFELQ